MSPPDSSSGRSARHGSGTAVLRYVCCGNSIRYWILALSFFILSSLFANMMIYGLVAVYYDKLLLLPDHFRQPHSNVRQQGRQKASSLGTGNVALAGDLNQIVSDVTPYAKSQSNSDEKTKTSVESDGDKANVHETTNTKHRFQAESKSTTSANSAALGHDTKINRNYHSNRRHRRKSVSMSNVDGKRINDVNEETFHANDGQKRNFNEDLSGKIYSAAKIANDEIDNNAVVDAGRGDSKELSSANNNNDAAKTVNDVGKGNGLNDVVNDDYSTQSTSKLPTIVESEDERSDETSRRHVKNSKVLKNYTSDDGSISSQPISYVDHDIIALLTQSLVFGAPGLGVLAAHFPSGLLLREIGAKWTIALALLISGLLTAAFPFLAEFGLWMVIFIRLLLGVCFSPALSFLGATAANWAKVSEQLFFVTFCFAALQLSLIISWRGALTLMTDLTWSGLSRVFGAHTAISGILLVIWVAFYEDTPQKHRLVSGIELNKIMTGRVAQQCQNNRLEQSVFARLLKSASAWVIWMTSFGYFLVFSMLAHFLPIYIFRVLYQRIDSTIVLPFILLFITHLLTYGVTHLLESSTLKVRIVNTMAFALSAVVFVALAVSPTHDQFEYFAQRTVWMLWISVAPLGLATGGFIESSVVYGRYFSQFIISNLQVPFGFALFISPVGVFLFTVDNAILRWRLVFFGCAACLALTAAMFAVLGRGQVGSWARQTWNPAATGKMRSLDPISATGEDCGLVAMRPIDEFLVNRSNTSVLLGGGSSRAFATH